MTDPRATTLTLIAVANGADPTRALGELTLILNLMPGIISCGSSTIGTHARQITATMHMPEVADE